MFKTVASQLKETQAQLEAAQSRITELTAANTAAQASIAELTVARDAAVATRDELQAQLALMPAEVERLAGLRAQEILAANTTTPLPLTPETETPAAKPGDLLQSVREATDPLDRARKYEAWLKSTQTKS